MIAVEHAVGGWRAVTLADDDLRVTVLPERGAEVHALVHRATGIDVLFHAPWGLAPPGAPPREGSDGHAFLERYAGGWQELFPSGNGPCSLPRPHDPVPRRGRDACRGRSTAGRRARARLPRRLPTVPFALERRIGSSADALGSRARAHATTSATRRRSARWGHHLVLGAAVPRAGCRFEPAARTIVTIPELWEDTARLEPGQRRRGRSAACARGGTVDLRDVPGPEAGSHDDVYLTDLDAGTLRSPTRGLGLAFGCDWDAAVFRWVIAWQPYGGAHALPLAGCYALGIEPWVAGGPLAHAVADGSALEIAAGSSVATTVRASVRAA